MSRSGAREGEAPPAPDPLSTPALDSHCHLDLMDVEPATAIRQAAAVGITRIVQAGVDVASSRWGVELAQRHREVFAAVAIHPNESPTTPVDDIDAIGRLAASADVVAVGETGLDHYRTESDAWSAQEASFRAHIQIARESGKAVMIHDRDAHEDVLNVLASEGAPEHVIFHCFSGDDDVARRCVAAGYTLSFAGNVTFKNAQHLRDALAVTPLDQMLVETDAPFLTPMPYRGRPNAPYLVPLTVRAVAEIKGVTEVEVSEAVTANAARVFGWS